MDQLAPALTIVTTNLPITVLVLFCFYKRWFRLGSDVTQELDQLKQAHAKEIELLTTRAEEYKLRWEEEKRARLAAVEPPREGTQ